MNPRDLPIIKPKPPSAAPCLLMETAGGLQPVPLAAYRVVGAALLFVFYLPDGRISDQVEMQVGGAKVSDCKELGVSYNDALIDERLAGTAMSSILAV